MLLYFTSLFLESFSILRFLNINNIDILGQITFFFFLRPSYAACETFLNPR